MNKHESQNSTKPAIITKNVTHGVHIRTLYIVWMFNSELFSKHSTSKSI